MKMNKRKIAAIASIAGIILVIVIYFIISENTACKQIEVQFIENESKELIPKEDIIKIIKAQYENIIGTPIDDLDLSLLESVIEMHPTVKNAEVYKKVDGILVAKIENRIPIIRIMPIKGPDFYIDGEGECMPISKVSSVRVIIANGNIDFNYPNKQMNIEDSLVSGQIKDLYLLAKHINDDMFMKAQSEQIYVTEENEYELIPKVGKHTVMIGDIFDYEKKLKYLKHFYIHILNKEGWRNYSYINLKYKGQIVCVKDD
jgi:cell division protein FtsQ